MASQSASGMSSTSSTNQDKGRKENNLKEIPLDSKGTGTLLVSPLSSEAKPVQATLIVAQPSTQQLGSTAGRAPVVIASVSASVSASDQVKKSPLVAKLTSQSGGEHLTGGQVAKICASTPQMNAVTTGSGKPKAFATMMGGGDTPPQTASAKKQSSAKKGTYTCTCV